MRWFPGLFILVGCAAFPAEVHADDLVTAEKIALGGQLTHGVTIGDGELNPYDWGLGVRASYTLEEGIYIGASFENFRGTTRTRFQFDASRAQLWQARVEAGYDFVLVRDLMALRPSIGFGHAQYQRVSCEKDFDLIGCAEASGGAFSLATGVSLPIGIGPVLIAPDAHFVVVASNVIDGNALLFGVSAGVML